MVLRGAQAQHVLLADDCRVRLAELRHADAEGRPSLDGIWVEVESLPERQPSLLELALGQ